MHANKNYKKQYLVSTESNLVWITCPLSTIEAGNQTKSNPQPLAKGDDH